MIRLIGTFVLLFLCTFALGSASADREIENTGVMADILSIVGDVVKEFPEIGDVTVTVDPLPVGIYAITVPGRISISNVYAWDSKGLQRSIEYDVSIGFHPALGHCSAAQFLAYHESAHLVDDSHGLTARAMLVSVFGDGEQLHGILSEYSFYRDLTGTINAGEALAEAFAAVRCNGGNWAERELNEILTD